MAKDIIQASSTVADYSATQGSITGVGANVKDGNFDTYWQCYVIENGSYGLCVGHRTTGSLTADFTLNKQYTVQRVVGKFYYSISITSGASSNTGGAHGGIYIYRDGAWEVVPGASFNVSNGTAIVEYDISDLNLERVEAVRGYINSHGDKLCCSACGGSTSAYGRIYELQAFVKVEGGYAAII